MRRCWTVILMVFVLSLAAFASYSQDFSGEGLPEGFKIVEGDWKVEEGRIVGESPSIAVQGRVVFGPVMDNFVYSVDITFLSAKDNARWCSVFFRASEDGASPYHMFTIRKGSAAQNGTELAFRRPDGQWDVRRKKPYATAFEYNKTYRVTVAVCDDVFLYFIDDELQFAAIETGYRDEGIFGLHVNGCKVAFDNITIEPYDRKKYKAIEGEAE